MFPGLVGLTITVQGRRPVEAPGGHSYAAHLGRAVTADLSKAHNLSVPPLFRGGEGNPIQMTYCGRGQSRDVWKGEDAQLRGPVVLKVCDVKWQEGQISEFDALL